MDRRGKIIVEALGLLARKAKMTVIVIGGWKLVSLIVSLIAVVAAVIVLEPYGKILGIVSLILLYHYYCVYTVECAQKIISNMTIDQQRRLLTNVKIVFDEYRIERGVVDAMMVLKNPWAKRKALAGMRRFFIEEMKYYSDTIYYPFIERWN